MGRKDVKIEVYCNDGLWRPCLYELLVPGNIFRVLNPDNNQIESGSDGVSEWEVTGKVFYDHESGHSGVPCIPFGGENAIH